MNIAAQILTAGRDSDIAVLQGPRSVTYADLRRDSLAIGRGLSLTGHQKGDRIGLLAENSPFFVSAYLGIIGAGLVAVPLPTDCPADSLVRIVANTQMRSIPRRSANATSCASRSSGVRPGTPDKWQCTSQIIMAQIKQD